MTVRIYTAYDPPPRVQLECRDPSLTRQSEAGACDINAIMARYEKTGILPVGREGVYADVSQMGSYQEVMGQVALVQNWFSLQPAELRGRFENNAALFADWVTNAENRAEAIELGLITSEEAVPAAVAPVPQEPVAGVVPGAAGGPA